MSKRRTKSEKIRAELRKNKIQSTNNKINSNIEIQMPAQTLAHTRGAFYTPSFELPMELLKKDLTKTLIVTILAVILQMSLANYLNHGGWNLINTLIINKLTGNF